MALPQTCIDHEPAQCVDLVDIAEHVLDECYRAVLPLLEPQADGTALRAYVTMGSAGDDGVTDALCVSFLGAALTGGSTAGNATLALPGVRASFQVMLRESGWPVVSVVDGRIAAPPTTAQAAAARHAFAHGEALYRHILRLNTRRQIAPMFTGSVATIGQLVPMPPQGGVVGWKVNFDVLMGWGGG